MKFETRCTVDVISCVCYS